MNFSSPQFLFVFLPFALSIYLLAGSRARPYVFTIASLLFCLWAGPLLFPVILVSTVINFYLGKNLHGRQSDNKGILIGGIIFNIALMLGFKLLVAYGPALLETLATVKAFDNLKSYFPYLLKGIALPVGISFYSFQAIAYLLDIASTRTPAETSFLKFTEYFTAFPKVVAGPITRYRDVVKQLGPRRFDWNLAGSGARRFILGLAKKSIIADQLAVLVDGGVFDQALPILSTPSAWLVLLCYTLQIYYDFSGYTDMAIGLGMIFGLRFPENFNFPYLSKSISEFWRRWHMTLSGWFREIVFFPLERQRARGNLWLNQYVNVLIVFFLTGLWHGVTVNFLIWGLLHGLAISFEVSPVGKVLRKAPAVLQHGYALIIIMFGWVFFRSNSPAFAITFLKILLGMVQNTQPTPYSILAPPTVSLWITLIAAIIFSMPIANWIGRKLHFDFRKSPGWAQTCVSLVLLAVSLVVLAGSTYQPYIYGNF